MKVSAFQLFSASVLFAGFSAWATIIPADRRIIWEGNVGIPGGIPTGLTVWCSNIVDSIPGVTNHCVGDGSVDEMTAINAAINGCPVGQVIQFPAGIFRINSVLSLTKGIVIRGAGVGLTIFTNDVMSVTAGATERARTALTANILKGETNLVVTATNKFDVGNIVTIEGGDDAAIVNRTGYETTANSPGQWFNAQIVARTGTSVTFWPPVPWDYKTNGAATLYGVIYGGSSVTNFISYAGFEDFTLMPNTTSDTSILFTSVAFCWLKNVEVAYPRNHCFYAHRAFRCQMFGCFFHDATINGSGGGYGVTLENGSSMNLFENNIMTNMTGSFQVNEGSSGNVFAYNYIPSSDYYDDRYNQPDFQNHSSHPLMNLWEGNVGFMALFDDIHGSSSHHTLLRNRLYGYQNATITHQEYCVGIEAFTTYCNVIGNVLGESHMDYYMMVQGVDFADTRKAIYAIGYDFLGRGNTSAQDTLLLHGNWDSVTATNGGIVWSTNTDHSIPNSYYLSSKPSWFANLTWPPVDTANTTNTVTTPATFWFANRYWPTNLSGPGNFYVTNTIRFNTISRGQ